MLAITASVRGSRRVTVSAGPFPIQIEPNADATEPGDDMAIDTIGRSAAAGVVLGVRLAVVPPDDGQAPPEHLLFDDVHAVATATSIASAQTGIAHLTSAVSTLVLPNGYASARVSEAS